MDLFAPRQNFKIDNYVSLNQKVGVLMLSYFIGLIYLYIAFHHSGFSESDQEGDGKWGASNYDAPPLWPGQPWYSLLRRQSVAYKDFLRYPNNLVGQRMLK